MNSKRNIFITGVTGTMGMEGFKQLVNRLDKFNITTLVRPSEKNKKFLAEYERLSGVKIIWGDLNNYEDIFMGIKDADYVLHVAALISPQADYDPYNAKKINLGSTINIIRAIREQKRERDIKLVYIGTVAETGDRLPPIHWGRTGDPLKPSFYDNYAVSKIMAEREVIESGLKYWVSLRQTGIAHDGLFKIRDGIVYHQPLNNCLEWITAHDSGLLLANVCEENVFEDFWCRVYNVGGGEECRTTGYEFMEKMYRIIGIKDIKKVLEPNWFALRNFHGQWFEDSDILNNYLHFRTESLKDFTNKLKKRLPFYMKLGGVVPPSIFKKRYMLPLTMGKNGPLYWIKNNYYGRIKAFFGSMDKWEKIPNWNKYVLEAPFKEPMSLSHGYDENKEKSKLDIYDMREAAMFRGGRCLSDSMERGDLKSKLKWECSFGHKFDASPTIVLLGGHWCPICDSSPKYYGEIAKRNPFFAQVWYPIHEKDEYSSYDEGYKGDIL